MKAAVLCYGEVGVDNIVRVPFRPTPENAAMPTSDSYHIGGAAANTAVWLAGLEVPVVLTGNKIGRDDLGQQLKGWLQQVSGLELRFLKQESEVVTPFCRILVTPDAERTILVFWYPQTPKTGLQPEILAGVRVLSLDLYGGAERIEAAQLAHESGVTVVVNDAIDPDHAVLPYSDIVQNSGQFNQERFPGRQIPEHARSLQAGEDRIIITTNGTEPVHVLKVDGTEFWVTPPVVLAVDATGAGDAFRAGLIYGWLEGWPLERCVCWGVAAGALKVQRIGGANDIPERAEVASLAAQVEASFAGSARG